VPSWQTTVVPELGGTTTVVFAGGGGLELEMQPVSRDAVKKKLEIILTQVFTLPPRFVSSSDGWKDARAGLRRETGQLRVSLYHQVLQIPIL